MTDTETKTGKATTRKVQESETVITNLQNQFGINHTSLPPTTYSTGLFMVISVG